ncbi:MAG: DUF1080 domain-containing protein, partial [Planctomycetes bacterium]|nr:DUF1080 domain-containing protein [Planctomycetota bacterium]
MRNLALFAACVGLLAVGLGRSLAADNCLTPEEKAEGWKLLFNGRDYTGWKCSNGKPVASPVEDGAIMPYRSGGYLVVYEKPFRDFILKCDVRMTEHCNSGIFLRVADLKDPVQTGFEVQILHEAGTGYHHFGAIYDLARPTKKAKLKPTGEWNSVTITCCGPKISVEVNGELICQINCDEFTEVGKRPDGSRHKFFRRGIPIKDFAREGYIGFQDHGHKVWFKNVKIKELDCSREA